VEKTLVEEGLQKSTKVGASLLRIVDAYAMANRIGKLITENPLFLIEPWRYTKA
jgi:hypothetical protein